MAGLGQGGRGHQILRGLPAEDRLPVQQAALHRQAELENMSVTETFELMNLAER